MSKRSVGFALGLSFLSMVAGCGRTPTGSVSGPAAIVGRVVTSSAGKLQTTAQLGCPTMVITLNGQAANVTVEDDCSFVIDNVQPSASYIVSVELVELDVTGSVTLSNILEAELIEIEVDADDDSLTISVVRRATPDPTDELPSLIPQNANNVEIFLGEGTYDNNLTVLGNNFTLVGEAGEDCDDEGWTVLSGDVVIDGNNATFRNVIFLGDVQVLANNTRFINVCFGGQLVIFGNNTDFGDDDDDDDDNGDDDDDDNDNGDDDDDDNDD